MAATLPLLLEHGRSLTSKQIAQAAGVAEGTIFRVFDTKEDLFQAVLEREFDPEAFLDALREVDLDTPLEERLLAGVTLLQERFQRIFALMTAMALPKPPPQTRDVARRRLAGEGLIRLVVPDADRFRVPPEDVVQLLRLLTFSGSHPHIADQQTLTPAQIVDTVLHGVLKGES